MDFFNYLQKKSETTVVYYILTYSKYVSKNTILININTPYVLISDHLVPATLRGMLLLGFLRTSCLSDIVNHKITQAELYSLMGQHHVPCAVPGDQSSATNHCQSRSHTPQGLNQDKNECFYIRLYLVILPLHFLASIQRNGLYSFCIRNVICHCFPSTGLSLSRLRPFAFMTVSSMCTSHCWRKTVNTEHCKETVRSVNVYSGRRN